MNVSLKRNKKQPQVNSWFSKILKVKYFDEWDEAYIRRFFTIN